MKIHVLTTGGTIEKSYDELEGTLENRSSVIDREIHQSLRLQNKFLEFKTLMSKDSLYMSDGDRQRILKEVQNLQAGSQPIIVLHGTDTMAETATLVHEGIPTPTAPIIFTGAMRPVGFERSDALQNVTEAIFAASVLSPGVYIVFHSQVLPLPRVRKNRQLRTFEVY